MSALANTQQRPPLRPASKSRPLPQVAQPSPGVDQRLWGHVRELQALFLRSIVASQDVMGWEALNSEVIWLHSRVWPEVMRNHHDIGVAASLTELAVTSVEGFAKLIATGSGTTKAAPFWREDLFRLQQLHQASAMQSGAAYTAFSMHAAIDWIGLRCAAVSGARPAAARIIILGGFYGIFKANASSLDDAMARAMPSVGRPSAGVVDTPLVAAPAVSPVAAAARERTLAKLSSWWHRMASESGKAPALSSTGT
jgi:hypothetical protein